MPRAFGLVKFVYGALGGYSQHTCRRSPGRRAWQTSGPLTGFGIVRRKRPVSVRCKGLCSRGRGGKRKPRVEWPKRSHDTRLGMRSIAAAAVEEEPPRPLRQLYRRSLLPARRDMDAPGQHPLILRMAIATSRFMAPGPPSSRWGVVVTAGGPSYAARLRACLSLLYATGGRPRQSSKIGNA